MFEFGEVGDLESQEVVDFSDDGLLVEAVLGQEGLKLLRVKDVDGHFLVWG
jgi:hypothetical protein